jgi:hypothetical protein
MADTMMKDADTHARDAGGLEGLLKGLRAMVNTDKTFLHPPYNMAVNQERLDAYLELIDYGLKTYGSNYDAPPKE